MITEPKDRETKFNIVVRLIRKYSREYYEITGRSLHQDIESVKATDFSLEEPHG